MAMRLADADVLPFDYTDYATQIRDFFSETSKLAKQRNLDSSYNSQSFLNSVDAFTKEATRIEQLKRKAVAENANSTKLREINDLLIQVERDFTDERGLRGRSWYKHQIYAPGIYTGYASQPLTDFRQAVDDRNSTNTKDALERISEAINRATERLRTVRD
jgi:N-acetylated-alpha-linked acidic dipeptidase